MDVDMDMDRGLVTVCTIRVTGSFVVHNQVGTREQQQQLRQWADGARTSTWSAAE